MTEEEFTLTFTVTPKMSDALAKVLKIKSKELGSRVCLSLYIRELLISDIRENYLKPNKLKATPQKN